VFGDREKQKQRLAAILCLISRKDSRLLSYGDLKIPGAIVDCHI